MPQCSFRELRGSLGFIFAVLALFWAAFWEFWGCLGLYFSIFGCLLGSILGALGALWAPFWLNWLPLGRLGGPNAPPAAQNRIFLNFALPFWRHFGRFLEVKIDAKINENLDVNLLRFWMHFGLDF